MGATDDEPTEPIPSSVDVERRRKTPSTAHDPEWERAFSEYSQRDRSRRRTSTLYVKREHSRLVDISTAKKNIVIVLGLIAILVVVVVTGCAYIKSRWARI